MIIPTHTLEHEQPEDDLHAETEDDGSRRDAAPVGRKQVDDTVHDEDTTQRDGTPFVGRGSSRRDTECRGEEENEDGSPAETDLELVRDLGPRVLGAGVPDGRDESDDWFLGNISRVVQLECISQVVTGAGSRLTKIKRMKNQVQMVVMTQ
jgi:hypothetical protein